tara:strand:+ start:202 stop:501 length:300 start_codon:yes stop_codon:yes gene_type:complete
MDYTDEQIASALKSWESRKKAARTYYKNRYATDEEFREKHKQKSRENYLLNKEKIAEKYQIEKKYKQSLRRFNYYKDLGELDKFRELYKEEYDIYFKGL